MTVLPIEKQHRIVYLKHEFNDRPFSFLCVKCDRIEKVNRDNQTIYKRTNKRHKLNQMKYRRFKCCFQANATKERKQ